VLLENGSLAPNVELPGDAGQFYNLSDYRGQKVILYFYPKDNTSGCTAQACGFQDQLEDFNNLSTVVFGISRDTPQSHDKFKSKYKLTFPLLSDVDGVACAAYGTWVEKSMYGKKYFGIERSTFLIDEKGIIRHIWRKVKVASHIKEVLETLHKI
jgi:thioredoxin-dependent peroxiredoxin